MLDNKQWDVFQTSTGLRGDSYGRGGCMELTNARIKHAALFERGEVDNTTVSKLDVLRIGRVKSGKPPPSNTAINNGEEPPRMTRAMREVKDCLREATMSLLDGDEAKKNDVLAVEQWLLMKTTAFDASGSKRKCEDDNNNNSKGPKTDEGQCNEKSKPTTLPAVATPIRSPTGPSMQTLSRHELQSGGNLVRALKLATAVSGTGQLVTPTRTVSSFPYPINACVTPENYPGLAHLSPNLDLLRRGEGINGVDLHKQLYQQVLQDFSKYSKRTGEPLEFQYFNGGHGERLILLPLSRNKAGTVKPVVNKCIDELLNACNNEEENDEVFDLLFNYLHKHHDKKLKAKLRENQLTHSPQNNG